MKKQSRLIGTELAGRYRITEELGQGGMGVVYRAHDPRLNRDVAIKMLPPLFLGQEAEARFQREAHLVAQLDHPGIVPIHDFGNHEGSPFFVMPMVHGTSLRAMIRQRSLSVGENLEILAQTAEALDYSHGRRVVHRDIKPENIMVTREGAGVRIRVMDFGLAVGTAGDRLTKTGNVLGTMAYFSPEQAKSPETVDGRSDIYSLGVILYECLTGKPPFSGSPHQILYRTVHEAPEPPSRIGIEMAPEHEELVLRCLEKLPSARPQRGLALAESLREWLAGLSEEESGRRLSAVAVHDHRTGSRTSFIGRRPELGELGRRLQAAGEGHCQFVLVGGELGNGKSRLLHELETMALARRIRVWRGRFSEQEGTFPFQGFAELIQDALRPRDTSSVLSSAPPDLGDLESDLLHLFPMLADLTAQSGSAVLPLGSVPKISGSSLLGSAPGGAGDRHEIFELLAKTLTRLAGSQPCVLLLENLHRADASIAALHYIVHRLAPTPILIIGTYNTETLHRAHPLNELLAGFADDPRFVSLSLGPLRREEHRELVESLVRSPHVTQELADRLYDATEGNPFFTVELVRSLLESGGIATESTGAWTWSGTTAISADALPLTIQQTIEKRLERLPDTLRKILATATVLGRHFDFEDLDSLLDAPDDLDDNVERLIREGFLEEDRRTRGDHLSFGSGLVYDVLGGDLSRRRRRTLHRKHAVSLERRWSGRLDRILPQLLHHFAEGDIADKTVIYGTRLAAQALEAWSPDQAIRAAKTALEFVDENLENKSGEEGALRLLLTHAHRITGQLDAAVKEAGRAVEAYRRAADDAGAARAALAAAEAAWQARRVPETTAWVEEGLGMARKSSGGSPNEESLRVLEGLLHLAATVANLGGDYETARLRLAEAEALRPVAATQSSVEIAEGGTLETAIATRIRARDPALMQVVEESEILANVFETLLDTDSQGNLVPCLAQAWEGSRDDCRFQLTLRLGTLFSDGTPLTASRVVDSLQRAARCAGKQLAAAYLAIEGWEEVISGQAENVRGISALDERTLRFDLRQPLPFFPVLLTELQSAVTLETPGEDELLGTGPFRVKRREVMPDEDGIYLERNPHWRGTRARLDMLHFRIGVPSAEIVGLLRRGEIDLGRDLLPSDLEEVLRLPPFRSGLVEALKKNVYFIAYHLHGPTTRHLEIRRALSGTIKIQDLVWRTLGRFAQPASSLIPPGIFGHDPGRRQAHPGREEIRKLLADAGYESSDERRVIHAAVHPILLDRYAALTAALFEEWREIGFEVQVETPTMETYAARWKNPQGLDVIIGRWMPDYDDPDSATSGLLHSRQGSIGPFLDSRRADEILDEARRERAIGPRQQLYRRFESLLADNAAVVPLFYDIDYRLVGARLQGVQLENQRPFVNYSEIGKVSDEEVSVPLPSNRRSGTIQAALGAPIHSLDPAQAHFVAVADAVSTFLETLTRIDNGARISPGLAAEFQAEDGGRRFRFRLREGVRFHDSRRLTVRDVRFSFERLLRNSSANAAWSLLPIRGAAAFRDGEAEEISGFHIESAHEIVFELDRPQIFFPAVLTHPTTAILPEGTDRIHGHWREGCPGTGPFRVVRFEPGRRLELEANPHYWRRGRPGCERLLLHLGVGSEEAATAFREGRLSLVGNLRPEDVKALRRDAEFASGYREIPGLSTYFLMFNASRGPFRDLELRRALAAALDVDTLVRERLDKLGLPAGCFIPPGLPGHEITPLDTMTNPSPEILREVDLRAWVNPAFSDQYAPFWEGLYDTLKGTGLRFGKTTSSLAEMVPLIEGGSVDLVVSRWLADYPDADSFVGALHSREGLFGPLIGNDELDALIEKGRAETDPALRHTIYREVERTLRREALVIPLFHEQVYRFQRPEVEGLRLRFSIPEVIWEDLRVISS